MKQLLTAALAATAILGAASAARADLTLEGAVGLPLNPTAQIPEMGGARIQANYFDEGRSGGVRLSEYGLLAAARVGQNIEINGGIDRFKASPSSVFDRTGLAIGAKYLFTRETDPAQMRIAAGIGYDQARLKNTYGYVVASKYLGAVSGDKQPVIGHLGLRYDTFRPGNGAQNSKKLSVYAGAEAPITQDGAFALVGEVESKNTQYFGAKIPYSASVRYRPVGQGFSVSAGYQREGISTASGFFAQLGYTFNTGHNSTATGTSTGTTTTTTQ